MPLFCVGVEHAFLLEIMRHGVLRQKRRLQADFGSDPFAFEVRRVGWMLAGSAAAELRPEFCALDLIKLLEFAPGGIADGAGYVDFEFENGHKVFHHRDTEAQRKLQHSSINNRGINITRCVPLCLCGEN
jgi:hypothetical protein